MDFRLTFKRDYQRLRNHIAHNGELVTVDGKPTLELLGVQVRTRAGCTVTRPKYNPAIGVVEGLAILAGDAAHGPLPALQAVAPKTFGEGYFGGSTFYSERLGYQLERAIHELSEKDPHSRRSVLHVGHPEDTYNNRPCIESVQLLKRGKCLHAFITMRSWDVIRGLPNDVMMWGIVLKGLAYSLGCVTGTMLFSAASLHIYIADVERTKEGLMQGSDFDIEFESTLNDVFNFDLINDAPASYQFNIIQGWAAAELTNAPWTDDGSFSIERKPMDMVYVN